MHTSSHHPENDALVQTFVHAWNAHDADQVVALYAADYQGEDVAKAEPIRGIAALHRSVANYLLAFPDIQFDVEQVVRQGDEVVLIWKARGTYQGHLMHIPPTGQTIEVSGISVLQMADGKIQRSRVMWDVAGLLRAMGLLPELHGL